MEKLHPKAVWIFFFRVLGFCIFLSVWLTSFLAGLLRVAGKRGFLWWLILGFIICLIFAYFWSKLIYRFWRYELTEDVFKKEHGIIWKKYVSIPYERIQNIDIHRGVVDRILGLSSLSIQTAGYGAIGGMRRGIGGEGYLPGLGKNKAEEIRDELIQRAKGKKQGL